MREDFLFLHGSKHDVNTARTVLVGVISLVLPINLLDGLRWGGSIYCFKYIPLEDFFLFFHGISQLIVGFSSVGSFA